MYDALVRTQEYDVHDALNRVESCLDSVNDDVTEATFNSEYSVSIICTGRNVTSNQRIYNSLHLTHLLLNQVSTDCYSVQNTRYVHISTTSLTGVHLLREKKIVNEVAKMKLNSEHYDSYVCVETLRRLSTLRWATTVQLAHFEF